MFGCDCIGKKCGTGDHLKTTPVCPPPSASHPTLKLNKPAFSHQAWNLFRPKLSNTILSLRNREIFGIFGIGHQCSGDVSRSPDSSEKFWSCWRKSSFGHVRPITLLSVPQQDHLGVKTIQYWGIASNYVRVLKCAGIWLLFRCQHFPSARLVSYLGVIGTDEQPPPNKWYWSGFFPPTISQISPGARCCCSANICRANILLDCAQINVHIPISWSLTPNWLAANILQHIYKEDVRVCIFENIETKTLKIF